MAIYVSAAYCSKCDKYFKAVYDCTKTGYRDPEPCPDCGGRAKHKHVIKGSEQDPNRGQRFIGVGYKDNPRWSWSMGVNVKDIPKMMKLYPDRNYHPKTGQLEVRNRPHKKKLMREHGYEETG